MGTITKVNFKAGDVIKKWQIIAEIDNSEANDSIEEAKIALENAEISLKQLYEVVDESKVIQAKDSIITSENNLTNAKIELTNLELEQKNEQAQVKIEIDEQEKNLLLLRANLEISKTDLELLRKEKENTLENTSLDKDLTITDIEWKFKWYLLDISETIEQSDYIMGVTSENRTRNDEYDQFLWVKDRVTKSKASSSLLYTISLYENLEQEVEEYSFDGDKDSIEHILLLYVDIYESIYETTNLIYETAENSISSIWSLEEWSINSIKNDMSNYRSSALSEINTINNSINTLNTLTDTDLVFDTNSFAIAQKEESINNNLLSIEKQENDIINLKTELDEMIANHTFVLSWKTQDIASKQVAIEVATVSEVELYKWPTADDITKANNGIKQADIKLESSYENLDDYVLQAPFDGVIRKIDYMPWDNLTNDTNKFVYIENPNLLEISVMLDQIDIVTVGIGQDAIITFDTYPTVPVKWKISSIDTTPLQSSGVISYGVKLVLDDPDFDRPVLSGMTAGVEIITESKEDILLVKTSALNEKDGKKYLTIEKNAQPIETEVETGLTSNGMTEITAGVLEGDTVLEREFLIITSRAEEADTTLFSPTVWWGGGWGQRGAWRGWF